MNHLRLPRSHFIRPLCHPPLPFFSSSLSLTLPCPISSPPSLTLFSRAQFPSESVHVLTDHSDEVWFLAFSHDGTRLASGAKDGQIIIWNISVSIDYLVLGYHIRVHYTLMYQKLYVSVFVCLCVRVCEHACQLEC